MKSTRTFHVYSIPPIDFWEGAITEHDFLESCLGVLRQQPMDGSWFPSQGLDIRKECLTLKRVKALVTERWHENVTETWVTAMPENGNSSMDHVYYVKVSNNGTVYVFTPHPMPWLGEDQHWGDYLGTVDVELNPANQW